MKRLLLDTHVLLWWLAGDRRLGASTRRLIEQSHCVVSVVSLVESAMKAATGRLRMPAQPIETRLQASGIPVVALQLPHVQAASRMMGSHGDPFDCLLVGTAMAERMSFVTRDAVLIERASKLLGDLLVEA